MKLLRPSEAPTETTGHVSIAHLRCAACPEQTAMCGRPKPPTLPAGHDLCHPGCGCDPCVVCLDLMYQPCPGCGTP